MYVVPLREYVCGGIPIEQKVAAVETTLLSHCERESALPLSTSLRYTIVKLYSWSVSPHQHNKPSMH